MRKYLIILVMLGPVCSADLLGQAPSASPEPAIRFDHITEADGLLHNNTRAILQDHLGFIWFGTQHGLVRFDGVEMQIYDLDASLRQYDREIRALCEDPDGNLWVGSDAGLYRFERATGLLTHYPVGDSGGDVDFLHLDRAGDLWVFTPTWTGYKLNRLRPDTGRWTTYQHDPDNPNSLASETVWRNFVPGNNVPAFFEDQSGSIWVGTGGEVSVENALHRYDRANDHFVRYRHDPNDPNSLGPGPVSAITKDEQGRLWVATLGGGLHRMDPAQPGRFTGYRYVPGNPETLRSDSLHTLFSDRSGLIWVMTAVGLDRLDPETDIVRHYTHDPDDVTTPSGDYGRILHENANGNLWIVTNAPGVDYYDRSADRFVRLLHHSAEPDGLRLGRGFNTFLADRSGTVWIGTDNTGVNRLERTPRFQHIRRIPGDPNSLSDNGVQDIYEAPSEPGVIWIGTHAGLDRLDRATGRFTHYRHDPNDPNSLTPGRVETIFEDRAGRFWVGTMPDTGQPGLNLMDRRRGTFTHLQTNPSDPNSLLIGRVDAITETRDGALWIGTNEGLTRFEPSPGPGVIDGTFTPYDRRGVTTLYTDKEGALWIGANPPDGLQRLDPESGQFTNYYDESVILAIHRDRAGRMWASGFGGLFRVDAEQGILRHYTRKEGLPSHNILGILEDPAGYLWLSTFNGLVRFDPETEIFHRYGLAYGLQDTQFNQGGLLASDGTMYFGGPNGISAFNPSALIDDPYPPPVVLTAFSLFNEPAPVGSGGPLDEDISVADQITLAHDQNDFTFHYAALNYSRPRESTYAYRLEPYETAWVQAGTARSSRYTNLSPGRYTFHVKAANADGLWNEHGRSIDITILPPWWRSTWAYVLYGLIFLGVVFAVDRMQRRRLIRQERDKARERELEQARVIETAHTELQQAHTDLEQAHTHLKATQAQLIQQEKMASLGQLTAGIAHEIKNPLNFVNNFSEITGELVAELKAEIDANPDKSVAEIARDFKEILADLGTNAERIHKHGKRADGIVQAMMQHASGGSGEREPTDVNALVSEYIDLAYHGKRAQAPDLNVEIERGLGADVGRVEMVPREIGRVLLNLLGNAFDAVQGQPDAKVTVSTGQVDGRVEIRVADNGPGISEEIREKIFEPFFTTKPTGSGTGLGLSLSYDIVTQGHGGTLTVESSEGEGATFIVTLPVNQKT